MSRMAGDRVVRSSLIALVGWTWWLGVPGAFAVTLSFPDEGLRLSDLAGQAGDYAWSAERVDLHGALDASDIGPRGKLEIEATGVAIHDAGFERAAENLRFGGTVEILELGKKTVSLRVDLRFVAGEVLVDTLYADLADFPVAVQGRIELPVSLAQSKWVRWTDAVVAIGGIGEARGSGRWALDGAGGEVRGTLDVRGLPQLYDLLYGVPAEKRRYQLEERGRVLAEVEYRQAPGGWFALSGRVNVSDVAVVATDPELRLSLREAEIPLALGTGELPESTAPGRITIGESTILGGPIGATVFPVEVGRNSIRLAASVRVPALGGAVDVRSFSAIELLSANRGVRLAVGVENVDLGMLSLNLGGPGLSGRLSATVPEIEVADGKLQSTGELVADVFEGRVRVRNLRGDRLGSTVPTFGFDVDFDAISLEELTRVFSFGYVSGVAKGGVRGLELVSWGPVAFEAWLETYPVSGVSQRISVDAIRQISVVGGGTSDPLSAGIMRFFDEYRYSKLGFHCRLHNDVFILDGVEVKDGNHYLVVGGWIPPRVDVISHVRKIAFSDMISRIAAVTSPGTEGKKPQMNADEHR
jgi:hypothetical protein